MNTQEQDKVREPLLKADGGLDDEAIDEPAEETRRTEYEQTHREGHEGSQHGSVRDGNKSQPTKDGISGVCGSD
jgi:hypothetical protein